MKRNHGEAQKNANTTASSSSSSACKRQHSPPRATQSPKAVITEFLLEAHAQMLEARCPVEVEARIGIFAIPGGSNAPPRERYHHHDPGVGCRKLSRSNPPPFQFVPGTSRATFESFRDANANRVGVRLHQEETRVYDYGDGHRVVHDLSKRVMVCERKRRHAELNLLLPAAGYDVRVAVATEERDPSFDACSGVPPGFISTRVKSRLSYVVSDHPWKVDLTVVTSANSSITKGERKCTTAATAEESVFEVEVELLAERCCAWLALRESNAVMRETEFLSESLSDVMETMGLVVPEESTADPSLPAAEVDAGGDSAAAASDMVSLNHTEKGAVGKSRFPGAMPVSFCRRHIQLVQSTSSAQNNAYFVAEKTDGVRKLLAFVQGGSSTGRRAVLVDRSFRCTHPPGDTQLAGIFPLGTVFDGELVHNRTLRRKVYMIFDILSVGSGSTDSGERETVTSRSFLERQEVIRRLMVNCYDPARLQHRVAWETLPLKMKKFFPRKEIGALFGRVRTNGRDRVYHDGDYRHHATDGVIFQQNSPYRSGADDRLLKWKWPDMETIDVEVKFRNTGSGCSWLPYFCFLGERGTLLDFSQQAPLEHELHDRLRLMADCRSYTDSNPNKKCIAEIAFSPDSGSWSYKFLRLDKGDANFYKTVVDTLMALSEGLSAEELQYRMLFPSPGRDDWSRRIQEETHKLLRWRQNNPPK